MEAAKEYDIFLSYAQEDRAEIAQPLAERLRALGLKVWYDQFEVRLGNRLFDVIGRGMANSQCAIAVISPDYLSKSWPRGELNSLFSLQMHDDNRVIFPILHRFSYEQMLARIPLLASAVYLSTESGVDALAAAIHEMFVGDSLIVDRAKRIAGAGTEGANGERDRVLGTSPIWAFLRSLGEMVGGSVLAPQVGENAATLARALGQPAPWCDQLRSSTSLLNIGKVGLPDAILHKPARLTPDEFEVMKSHTVRGATLLSAVDEPEFRMAAVIARSHHERWDGKGYPDQLVREQIPLECRIVSVVDALEALMKHHPYRGRLTRESAVEQVVRMKEAYAPDVLDAFVANSHLFSVPD